PVRASSLAELAGRYERGERTPLADLRPDLPDDFIRIVERACDTDPERRYSTVAGVKEALSRTLGWDTWTRKQPVVAAAGADPALTPLVIEQLAQDLSSSPPFRVIAPVAVEPMLGQPPAAIMHAVDADVYVEVAVTRRGSAMEARLEVVRAGGQTHAIHEA